MSALYMSVNTRQPNSFQEVNLIKKGNKNLIVVKISYNFLLSFNTLSSCFTYIYLYVNIPGLNAARHLRAEGKFIN